MDAGRMVRLCFGVAVLNVALLPGLAAAATAPEILTGPVIGGTARVGSLLTATATWRGDPTPTAAWSWVRCARATGTCDPIAGATSATYRPVAADVGSMLRVRLRVTNTQGSAEKRSDPTAAVVAAPAPTPTPTPTATPVATPTPTPTRTPAPTATATATVAAPATPVATVTPAPTAPPQRTVDAAAPAPTPSAAATPVAAPAPTVHQRLRPFPVVRIKGVLTQDGARVTLLSVRAPQGSRVRVLCRGLDCPVRTYLARSATGRMRPFERELRVGTRLEIRVTKPGYIGKSTVFVIRREAEPRRTDRCLPPGAKRAVRCPAT